MRIDEKYIITNQDILVSDPPASCVDHIHKLTVCPEQDFDQDKSKKNVTITQRLVQNRQAVYFAQIRSLEFLLEMLEEEKKLTGLSGLLASHCGTKDHLGRALSP